MKPKEQKPEEVFRIIDRETGALQSTYSRACCDEYDFGSLGEARASNCHGIYKDRAKYAVARYKVTYELIDPDVEPASNEDIEQAEIKSIRRSIAYKVAEKVCPKNESSTNGLQKNGVTNALQQLGVAFRADWFLARYVVYLKLSGRELVDDEETVDFIASLLSPSSPPPAAPTS